MEAFRLKVFRVIVRLLQFQPHGRGTVTTGEVMDDQQEIRDVLSRYVRATDNHDGRGQAGLFTKDGEIGYYSRAGFEEYQLFQEPSRGRERIRADVGDRSLPEGTQLHHLTSDHLIEVNGDDATLTAQFFVIQASGPKDAPVVWQGGLFGLRGEARITMIGFYDGRLRRVGGEWKFTRLDVQHSLPLVARPSA